MDLYELFNTPIEDLYEMGILPEPEPERNKRMCVLTFACCICHQEYTETYNRNCPDSLCSSMYCTSCGIKSMFLAQAVANTVHYRSRTMERGSLCDDVSAECWQCGATNDLHCTAMSNGQEIKLCSAHFKTYVKHTYKATQRKLERLQETYDESARVEATGHNWQERHSQDEYNYLDQDYGIF